MVSFVNGGDFAGRNRKLLGFSSLVWSLNLLLLGITEDDINSIVLSLAIVPRLSYGLTIGY
jgi:hypothetical protein